MEYGRWMEWAGVRIFTVRIGRLGDQPPSRTELIPPVKYIFVSCGPKEV